MKQNEINENSKEFEELKKEVSDIEDDLTNEDPVNRGQDSGTDPGSFSEDMQEIDISEIVLEMEKIGSSYLEKIHEDLKIDEAQLEVHSKLLAHVLQKHFSANALQNSPEVLLVSQTAIIAVTTWKKYDHLERTGQLSNE